MWQNSTAHENSNLLDDFDTSVPSLPRLLTLTDSLQERQEGRDTQS
uniref:Uncharacterized protein n=1 Tax=Arundo donax TaxID=35708 RepID=A0A0A9FZ15_ARUDO